MYTQLEKQNAALEHKVKELREAQDAAEHASNAKSIFLSTMSHEIRTPLNGVIGTTQLLLDSNTLNTHQTDMVETIRDSGQLLLALISDVLDLTKIEAGKFDLDDKPFDVRHCIEAAIDVIALKAADKV